MKAKKNNSGSLRVLLYGVVVGILLKSLTKKNLIWKLQDLGGDHGSAEVNQPNDYYLGRVPSSDDGDVVNCPSLLSNVRKRIIPDPNGGKLFGRYTIGYPYFWISLHNYEYDKVRYSIMQYGKYYEVALSSAFTQILDQIDNDDAIVIDVGGNIGWFSLVAAALGHNVYSFEPNIANVIRMCESICINGWDSCSPSTTTHRQSSSFASSYTSSRAGHISIRTMGIEKHQGEMWMIPHGISPGAMQIVKEINTTSMNAEQARRHAQNSFRVKVETLDRLALQLGWYQKTIAILKIDVEGLESQVLQGAQKILESKIVANIFLEGNVFGQESLNNFFSLVDQLLGAGYKVYKIGGHRGPTRADIPERGDIKNDILWACQGFGGNRKRRQCNIWWRLADLPPLKDATQ